MKTKILTIIIILVFNNNVFSVAPSCSKSGTSIVYINGMFNGSDDPMNAGRLISEKFSDLLNPNLNLAKRIDSNGVVDVSYVYQKSEYKIEVAKENSKVLLMAKGALSDGIEAIMQHFADEADNPYSDRTIDKVYSAIFHGADIADRLIENSDPAFAAAYSYIKNKLKDVIITPLVDNTAILIEADLQELENHLKPKLLADRKVILVSHSQGNWYANDVYTRLFESVVQDPDVASKAAYYGNLSVASPASFVKAPYHAIIKGKQDQVVGYVPGSLGYTHIYNGDWSGYDRLGHNFINIYLNKNLLASQNGTGPEFISMEDLFYEKMESVASRLAPNCCYDSSGSVVEDQFERHSYNKYHQNITEDERTFIGFYEKSGGWVSKSASVNIDTEVAYDAIVCAGAELKGYNIIGNSTVITGNVEMENIDTSFGAHPGERIFIHGLGSHGVKIIGNSFDFMGGKDFPLTVRTFPEFDNDDNVVENSSLSIVGNVLVTGAGTISSTQGGNLEIKGENNQAVIRFSDHTIGAFRSSINATGDSSITDSTFYADDNATKLNGMHGKIIMNNGAEFRNSHIDNSSPSPFYSTISGTIVSNGSTMRYVNLIGGTVSSSSISNDQYNVPAGGYRTIASPAFLNATVANSIIGDSVTITSSGVIESTVGAGASVVNQSSVTNGSTISGGAVISDSSINNSSVSSQTGMICTDGECVSKYE